MKTFAHIIAVLGVAILILAAMYGLAVIMLGGFF